MLTGKPRRVAPPAANPVAPVVSPPRPPFAAVPPPKQSPAVLTEQDESSQLRKLGFYAGLALVFMRISVLPELLGIVIGTNLYLLYIVTPLAVAGILFTGGLRRTMSYRPARYWMTFFAWMVLATGFSSWIGGSLTRLKDYGLYTLMLMFVVGGMAVSWGEVRLVFYALAAAGMVNLLEARLFTDTVNGRMQLWENGTISNSNDLASQLLLVLPFLLWVVTDSKRSVFIRIPFIPVIAYGLWVVVGTASRGALIGIFGAFLFALWRANMRQRILALFAGAILAVFAVVALPQSTVNRLGSLFGEQNKEADESADARSHLFRQSLLYTAQHPVFGVGPDQFSNYSSAEHEIKRALYHPTHCAWTQVSSECGVPGLIFFVLGLGSAIFSVSRTYKAAREKGNSGIATACFCYLLAIVGFLVSITFLSNAYSASMPIVVGLGIAISAAGARQMQPKSVPVPMPSPVRY